MMISQLPQPYIFNGEYNSHSEYCGNITTNARGRFPYEITDKYDFTVLELTYYSSTYRSWSTIDFVLGLKWIFHLVHHHDDVANSGLLIIFIKTKTYAKF